MRNEIALKCSQAPADYLKQKTAPWPIPNKIMSATPQPSPEAGGQPASTSNSEAQQRRRAPGKLDAQQSADIKQVILRCLAAQKPEYAGPLAAEGITAAFVTGLLSRARAISNSDDDTLDHASDSQVATRSGKDAKRTLITSLRGLQQSGRQLHQDSNPEKLADYLIGEDITSSRAVLDRSAQALINKAGQERGPGVNTDVIVRVQNELGAIGTANQTQEDERLAAQAMRQATANEVEAIKADCRKILFAADRAWPHTKPTSAPARAKFQLPRNRTYAPRTKQP